MIHTDKKALVCGAGGFIGHHLVKELKKRGFGVVGVDLKQPEFEPTQADVFWVKDLRDPDVCNKLFTHILEDMHYDYIFQLAADMGGAGFVFTGEHDADILHNSALINLNMLDAIKNYRDRVGRVFFSSSACVYPQHNQLDPENPNCKEDTAYPADPDSDYGFEKLFSERMYFAYAKNYGIDIRVARYHNIYGPLGTYDGGREKAPAALSRKIANVPGDSGRIQIWGNGNQTRSFLYIDDCIEATLRFMEHYGFMGPLNIGSEEMVSINQLAEMIADIAGKNIELDRIPGPLGVAGRNSDNALIESELGWTPQVSLREGLAKTYKWIRDQDEYIDP